MQFGTNHLGHFALTGLLLDLLLNTEGSRIVNVSSTAHAYGSMDLEDPNWETRPYRRWASYAQSKLANLLFTLELQRRLLKAGSSTLAVSCHPGWTATDLQRHSGLIRFFNPFYAMKPPQGALPTLFAATSDEVVAGGYYGPHGWQQMRGYPKAVESTDAAKQADTANRLWDLSEEMTGVRFDLPAAGD